MRRGITLTLALLLALWPTFALSRPTSLVVKLWHQLRLDQPVVAVGTTRYYEIHGATAKELRQALIASSPREANGQPFDGRTAWSVAWVWPTAPDGSCRLDLARLIVRTTVLLPRWTPPPSVSQALVEHWQHYLARLAHHEALHVALVAQDVPVVLAAIHGATCATANAAATRALTQLQEQSRAYDVETAHGATQGAIFP